MEIFQLMMEPPEKGHGNDELEHHRIVPKVGRRVTVDGLPQESPKGIICLVLLQVGHD